MKTFLEFSNTINTEHAYFKPGDKVIIRNAHKYATLKKNKVNGTVKKVNGKIIIIDIGSDTLNIDIKDLELLK